MSYAILNVDGKKVKANELTYDDLLWLFHSFINKNHHVPVMAECLSKNNLPQGRIINRILEDNNITYNDFMNIFGKVSHVRTENKLSYNEYVDKYISKSKELGHALKTSELMNNKYGLPSSSWFVKYCPDQSVKNFNDFVIWCKLEPNNKIFDKTYIIQKLKEKERDLRRPLRQYDITKEKIGFSIIVIKRIWGSWKECKHEIGLLKTPTILPRSFEEYKKALDDSLKLIKSKTTRSIITWKDIESFGLIEHKSVTKAFNRENIDLFKYILECGFVMNPSNYSFHYTFESGERVLSTFEYDFSLYLNELGYKYNRDYKRDVMYKDFINLNKRSKITCDYVFNEKYIEILGIIHNYGDDWRTHKYKDKQSLEYQTKMIDKEKLLIENNKKFLFLFPEDFITENYRKKFLEFINE